MNAQELYQKIDNEYKPIRYYCENCGTIYSDKDAAEDCCKPYICSRCGREIIRDKKKGYFESCTTDKDNNIICYECYIKEKESKLPFITEDEYKGEPVFWNDDFYLEFGDFIDDVECIAETEEDIPDYVFLTEKVPVAKINIDRVLENLYEANSIEEYDMEDLYTDLDELKSFIKEWNDKQTHTIYEQCNTKLMLSDKTKQDIKDALKEHL